MPRIMSAVPSFAGVEFQSLCHVHVDLYSISIMLLLTPGSPQSSELRALRDQPRTHWFAAAAMQGELGRIDPNNPNYVLEASCQPCGR